MSKQRIAELRARYAEFDAVLAFVKEHKLPTGACSIRAWPLIGRESIQWGYSYAAENVALAICQARESCATGEEYPLLEKPTEQGKALAKLRARWNGSSVFVYEHGYRLISFARMTPAEAKHVDATAAVRGLYRRFDDVLEFVEKNKFPRCKCSVMKSPQDQNKLSYGYSQTRIHVAAALCRALEDTADGIQWPVDALMALKLQSEVVVMAGGWPMIRVQRLSRAEVNNVKAEWLKGAMAKEKCKPRAKQVTPERLRECDPFKSDLAGMDLYPYMPGGVWDGNSNSRGSGGEDKIKLARDGLHELLAVA